MSGKRKVAIVGTMGLPACYGGFETLVHFLVLHLGAEFDFTVYCSAPDYKERLENYLFARLRYMPLRANGAQSILYDAASLVDACSWADVILVLGVSGGIFLPLAKLFGKKTVLNIGGLDWQRSKWGRNASRFLQLSEKVAVGAASVLIADNEAIGTYLESSYGRASRLIEYGGDQIARVAVSDEGLVRYPFLSGPYAFSVARIQSDNNIEMILEAFGSLPDQKLVFVGNWSASAFGRALKARYEAVPNLHLLEAIYAPDILNMLRGNCSLYLHGHSAGGTNPSLVEAMHLALPIAAFDVSYNRATTENAARYFKSVDELKRLLETTPADQWESLRAPLARIADKRYRWQLIAKKYAALF